MRALSASAAPGGENVPTNESSSVTATPTTAEEQTSAASSWWTQDPSDVESAANAASAMNLQDPDPSALGYSPMDLATAAIDYFHYASDLPWWLSIVAVAGVLRLSVLPLTVLQMRNQTRMVHMTPEIQALQARMQERPAETQDEQLMYQQQMMNIQARHGVKVWTSILPALAQLPIFLTMFWTLRDMAAAYPSFAHGGTLWFPNLAEADPTYGLPIVTALSFIAMTELAPQGEMPNNENAQRMKLVMRVVAVSMVPIAMTQPAAIAVYWTASNAFSLMQTFFFRIPGAKEAMGITLLPEIAARAAATPVDAGTGVADQKVYSNKPRRQRFSRRQE
ncbi:Mitochondrial inner membrane protein OXA1 [Hondaea fermentalgiana]|uniref:Mitochondrial inner membrane protein OXA1 n=1 Tax=Hondaea fermentalgiana TaxID=2315210 RepID=A0A2R5GCP2_9STRA|nr:Mitochondrial inner membrane protein OXA1 [Hondaea fermentalgiana]|eukprot:GBG25931.1 Mitochondrial inner membrane protein OXA1 [Hondaea fermentalgiana]